MSLGSLSAPESACRSNVGQTSVRRKMPKKVIILPENRSDWSFGQVLWWHLCVQGTRPTGKPTDKITQLWPIKKAAKDLGVSQRGLWNWLNDASQPYDTANIEQVLFGSNPDYADWRAELVRKLYETRTRREQAKKQAIEAATPSPAGARLEVGGGVAPAQPSVTPDPLPPIDEPAVPPPEAEDELPIEPAVEVAQDFKPEPAPEAEPEVASQPEPLTPREPEPQPARKPKPETIHVEPEWLEQPRARWAGPGTEEESLRRRREPPSPPPTIILKPVITEPAIRSQPRKKTRTLATALTAILLTLGGFGLLNWLKPSQPLREASVRPQAQPETNQPKNPPTPEPRTSPASPQPQGGPQATGKVDEPQPGGGNENPNSGVPARVGNANGGGAKPPAPPPEPTTPEPGLPAERPSGIVRPPTPRLVAPLPDDTHVSPKPAPDRSPGPGGGDGPKPPPVLGPSGPTTSSDKMVPTRKEYVPYDRKPIVDADNSSAQNYGFKIREGSGVEGRRLNTLSTRFAADCALACRNTQGCEAFDFYRDELPLVPPDPRTCELYTRPYASRVMSGHVQGRLETAADRNVPNAFSARLTELIGRDGPRTSYGPRSGKDEVIQCPGATVKVIGFRLTCDWTIGGGTTLGSARLSYNVSNINECAAKCGAVSACTGFTYNSADPPGHQACMIFGGRTEGRTSKGWIAGQR